MKFRSPCSSSSSQGGTSPFHGHGRAAFAGMMAGAILLLPTAGCSVQFLDDIEDGVTQNVCESTSDCGGGTCKDGICQIDTTELSAFPALLLEVTPPTGTPVIAGVSFTNVVEKFDWGPAGHGIQLGHVGRIRGSVKAAELSGADCLPAPEEEVLTAPATAPDGSIPVRLTLTPRSRLLGLPSPSLTTQAKQLVVDDADPSKTGYALSQSAPGGRYDIYAEPLFPQAGCVRPPYLIVDETIDPGNVYLNWELPTPEILGVTVRYPLGAGDLKGWTLDMIDRDSGRLLSNRVELRDPETTETALEYSVALAFSQVESSDAATASELVRLSPPDDLIAPTVYVERSVVDLFQDGTGLIDQLGEISDPVTFSGRVTLASSLTPAPSTITLVATEIESTGSGTVAAFSRIVETEEDGSFATQLLPGTYRMMAEPRNADLARALGEFIVSDAASTQTGRTIQVHRRNSVTGRVVSFNNTRIAGAPLWASAVPADDNVNVLEAAQGVIASPPAAAGMETDAAGEFELLADEGTFHISARPEPSTGFPWGVQLGVQVPGSNVQLGRIDLPLPLVVRGKLTSGDIGDVVPDALIRAYALLKEGVPVGSAEEADSVVAVGESRVDSKGSFRLLLPSTFK